MPGFFFPRRIWWMNYTWWCLFLSLLLLLDECMFQKKKLKSRTDKNLSWNWGHYRLGKERKEKVGAEGDVWGRKGRSGASESSGCWGYSSPCPKTAWRAGSHQKSQETEQGGRAAASSTYLHFIYSDSFIIYIGCGRPWVKYFQKVNN